MEDERLSRWRHRTTSSQAVHEPGEALTRSRVSEDWKMSGRTQR